MRKPSLELLATRSVLLAFQNHSHPKKIAAHVKTLNSPPPNVARSMRVPGAILSQM
jgi:hypothetical protein